MREIDKYGALKEKLAGICDENDLTFKIHNQGYPFRLVVKPLSGMDAQQTMMEGMENSSDTGYISPDASLVFAYRDGDLTYKISETWTIGDSLFNKLKNHFKKLHFLWMQYFYRDVHENSPGAIPKKDGDTQAPANDVTDDFVTEDETAEAVPADPAEDPFAGFMDDEDAEDTADAISTLTDISDLDYEDV